MHKPVVRTAIFVFLATLFFVAIPSTAKEPPAMIYIKAKCALCHGVDGSGNTPAGRQSGVKSFNSAEVKGQSDEELAVTIAEGKGKMPGFGQRLDRDQISLMVRYVRDLGSAE